MAVINGKLHPAAPFDFDKSLNFLGHFRPAMGEQGITNRTLTKALTLNGQTVGFQIRSEGTVEAPQLAYTLYSDAELSPETQATALERISFFLSLSDDLRPFYAIGEQDEAFAPIVRDMYGYHQVKFPSPFENACWAILSQRNPMSTSHAMKDRVTAQYGGAISIDGVTHRAFPEAFQLAGLDHDDLNGVIRNVRKTQCILAASQAFAQVDENWLYTAPYESVESWLRSIDGIGPWSASFILLRGLGRMEHLPYDEKWLLEGARRAYGSPALQQKDLHQLAKPYSDYTGYWAHYLRAAM